MAGMDDLYVQTALDVIARQRAVMQNAQLGLSGAGGLLGQSLNQPPTPPAPNPVLLLLK